MHWQGIIHAYGEFMPVRRGLVASLHEGNTPLIRSRHLSSETGLDVYLKCEGLNPTGSFKDRGMVVAVAGALEGGSRAVMCASTGNTSASAAAYAARNGLGCHVVVPDGNIAAGKLAQALAHNATVMAVKGSFDEALEIVRGIAQQHAITLVNSVNPHRIQGQKTAAFEICDQLGEAPDYLAVPVGNAGNLTALWQGFVEYRRAGKATVLPKMLGFQAAGAAPMVLGKVVSEPETVATAIRIGNPASWQSAAAALGESGGRIDAVTDDEIMSAQRELSRTEGVLVEPASAASVAGALKHAASGLIPRGASLVCILTGHGLKDPEALSRHAAPPVRIPATEEAVLDLVMRP